MKSYSANAIKNIINTFNKNNVKLQFENPSDLYASINSIIRQSTRIHINEIKKSLCGAEMKEYDVYKKQYLSNIKGYTYAWLSILADEKIAKQISIIKEGMYYYDGLLDLASPFAICYKMDSNVIEGYYYSFSYKNLLGKDNDFVDLIYDGMKFSEKTKSYLTNLRNVNPNNYSIHYLAFDFMSVPVKMGFRTSIKEFLQSDIINFYSDYIHLENVVECIRQCHDYDTEVGLQFIPQKNYIAIDINLKIEDVTNAIVMMTEMNIMGKDEENYTKTLFYQGLDAGLTNVTWKYRWNSKNKFTIKHYNYFTNNNVPAFLAGA
jgi:hypothetical protein